MSDAPKENMDIDDIFEEIQDQTKEEVQHEYKVHDFVIIKDTSKPEGKNLYDITYVKSASIDGKNIHLCNFGIVPLTEIIPYSEEVIEISECTTSRKNSLKRKHTDFLKMFERRKFDDIFQKEVLSVFDEEFVDIQIIDQENDYMKANVIIHFPEIKIENDIHLFHIIKDLYVRFTVIRDNEYMSINYFMGLRGSLSNLELSCNYAHSHLDFSRSDSLKWYNFCIGSGDFADSVSRLMDTSLDVCKDIDLFMDEFSIFLYGITPYVSWESLTGGPYRKISKLTKYREISVSDMELPALTSLTLLEQNVLKQSNLRKLKYIPHTIGGIVLLKIDPDCFTELAQDLFPKKYYHRAGIYYRKVTGIGIREYDVPKGSFFFKGQDIRIKKCEDFSSNEEEKFNEKDMVINQRIPNKTARILNSKFLEYQLRHEQQ